MKDKKIRINGELIVDQGMDGRCRYYVTESGGRIYKKDAKIFERECSSCKKNIGGKGVIKARIFECYEKCQQCRNNEVWLGRKHTQEAKDKISKANKGKLIGEKNPWYGKSPTEEIRKKMSQAKKGKQRGKDNPFFGKKHPPELQAQMSESVKRFYSNLSEEEKKRRSLVHRESQRKIKEKDPEAYSEMKRKAGLVSISKRVRYKKNKIETIVETKLKELGLNFQYSVIIGHKQYDFGCRKSRVLLEVQGDYWHGNKNIYKEEDLNPIQKTNISRDILKKEFAEKHNMKLFYIWEEDINSGNFEVLKQIKEYIDGL